VGSSWSYWNSGRQREHGRITNVPVLIQGNTGSVQFVQNRVFTDSLSGVSSPIVSLEVTSVILECSVTHGIDSTRDAPVLR